MQHSFFTTRREFLSGSLSILSAAATAPLFLRTTAQALAGQSAGSRPARDSETILVVVQLAGGNDGLNTIVPIGADPYYQLRPRLALAKGDVLRLTDACGLHPAATALKELYDAGRMAVIHGVGYPNPNRSHFVSMDVWHTADPSGRAKNGWLGRYFDAQCRGHGGGHDGPLDPSHAIALMSEAPLALQGESFAPLSFRDADTLVWRGPRNDPRAEEVFKRLNQGAAGDAAGDKESGSPLAQFLQRAALQALVGADEIRAATGDAPRVRGSQRRRRGRRAGGGQLFQQLQSIAGMIAADLPTRVYYASLGGFDTHAGQLNVHASLMREFGEAMHAFLETLESDGLLDRVLVMSFSEFGRRVQENASGGTDHGEAAPMFLFGNRVKAGLHGEFPDLRQLHRGDLAHTLDFRRVYATVLRDWLKVPSTQILGPSFAPMPLLERV